MWRGNQMDTATWFDDFHLTESRLHKAQAAMSHLTFATCRPGQSYFETNDDTSYRLPTQDNPRAPRYTLDR